MIYLIDDNQNRQRQNNYNITYIEEGVFDGYLSSIEKIEKTDSISDISYLSFLKNADCILLHSTTEDYDSTKGFLSGSKTNVTKIIEEMSQEGEKIPLVLFSNSMNDPKYNFEKNPNFIREIKKNIFYERLYDFLYYYKKEGKVELNILAYGKSFNSQNVVKLALEILSQFNTKDINYTLKPTDLSPILSKFKMFIEITLPKENFNNILNDIEDNPIQIGDFKKKIKQTINSIEKYGKNIYNW